MSTKAVSLRDPEVEPTAAQFDAVTKAALKKVLQRRAAAERRFRLSLEQGVKRALEEAKRRQRLG